MTTLTPREIETLRGMRDAYHASVQRKRSWRASEKAMAMADATQLVHKLIAADDTERQAAQRAP